MWSVLTPKFVSADSVRMTFPNVEAERHVGSGVKYGKVCQTGGAVGDVLNGAGGFEVVECSDEDGDERLGDV